MAEPDVPTKTIVRTTPEQPKGLVGIAGITTAAPVVVVATPWWELLLIRVARVYLQSFFGLWGATGTGLIEIKVKLSVAAQWGLIATVLAAALAPTFITLLQNALEFLTKLDQTRPGLRA